MKQRKALSSTRFHPDRRSKVPIDARAPINIRCVLTQGTPHGETQLLRVFIVEDTQDFADALAEFLAGNDAKCKVVGMASTETQAIEWSFANEAGFDVAIVDLLLKQGSGFTVLAHLNKYQPGKVVILSDFVTPALAERCKGMGAAAAFSKGQTLMCVDYIRNLASR